MKSRTVECEDVVELVPRLLNLQKILVPIDFSETSKKALQYAVRFAEQFGCEIVLLNVVEPVTLMVGAPLAIEVFPDTNDDLGSVKRKLGTLAAQRRTSRADSIDTEVRSGHAPNEIIKAARDWDVDLIVIATHGCTSWRHFCIGSTAERVVRSAPCPVLVVREKEHEFV
jgi:nucleotide-binding universal stress UspA family protein